MRKLRNSRIFIYAFVCIIALLLVPRALLADVVLSDKEYSIILNRLKLDREIINTNNIRWSRLKSEKPKIDYVVLEDGIVVQTIEIPIYNAAPLIYKVNMKIDILKEKVSFFPFTFFLMGSVESIYQFKSGESFTVYPDVKLGCQFFSLRPLSEKLRVGLNASVGIQSIGGSLSYTFPKYIKNTSVHLFFGLNYKSVIQKDPRLSYGLGISLNF